MRKAGKRMLVVGAVAAVLVALPWAAWVSLTHSPRFYRAAAHIPPERRQAEARAFVAQSLQLRNDIHNEPTWEAVFSDEQVNAWLAEDLVVQFADQLPPEVHEPRVAFETDRITLAFQLDQGPIRSVIWIVARVRVPEENVLALTLEKIRAGVVPLSADRYLDRIAARARENGLDLRWERDDGLPMAVLRYESPGPQESAVVLERIRISEGEIRLAGRSNRVGDRIDTTQLPSGRFLQSTFLNRRLQLRGVSAPGVEPPPAPGVLRSSTRPAS